MLWPPRYFKLGVILLAPVLHGRHRRRHSTVRVPGVSPRPPPLVGLLGASIRRHITVLIAAFIDPEVLHVQVLLLCVLQSSRDHVGNGREELLGLLSEHVLHLILLHHIGVPHHHHRVYHVGVAHHGGGGVSSYWHGRWGLCLRQQLLKILIHRLL